MAVLPDSLGASLLSQLQCPGCSGYLAPPILQCAGGHCACASCRAALGRCGLCGERFTTVRCRALEAIAERYSAPCANSCGYQGRLSELEAHRARCPLRAHPCLLRPCSWFGRTAQLAAHVVQQHPGHTFSPGPGHFSRKWSGHYVKLAALGDELFWYHLVQDTSKPKFFRAFQYIGPPEDAAHFQYSFDFSLPDSANRILFKRRAFSELDDIQREFQEDVDFHFIVRHALQRHGDAEKIPCVTELSGVLV